MAAMRAGEMAVTDENQPEWYIEPWLPHEQPERPFDEGTWLCDCESCCMAVRAEAAHSAYTPLCIKSGFDRVVVSAEYLAETLAAERPIESLLYVSDDWVREIFVPAVDRSADALVVADAPRGHRHRGRSPRPTPGCSW